MNTIKQEAYELIQKLPDNCTFEDIQYHFYVLEKVKNGLDRAKKGEVLNNTEAKKRLDKWLTN